MRTAATGASNENAGLATPRCPIPLKQYAGGKVNPRQTSGTRHATPLPRLSSGIDVSTSRKSCTPLRAGWYGAAGHLLYLPLGTATIVDKNFLPGQEAPRRRLCLDQLLRLRT
jgi:hypothetical protein